MKKLILIPLLFIACKKESVPQQQYENVKTLELVQNANAKLLSVDEKESGQFKMIEFKIEIDKNLKNGRYYSDAKKNDTILDNIKKSEFKDIIVSGYFPDDNKEYFTVIYAGEKPKTFTENFNNAAKEFTGYTADLIQYEKSPSRSINEVKVNPSEMIILKNVTKGITYDWMSKRYNPEVQAYKNKQ